MNLNDWVAKKSGTLLALKKIGEQVWAQLEVGPTTATSKVTWIPLPPEVEVTEEDFKSWLVA